MDDKETLLEALNEARERTLALVDTLTAEQLRVPYHPGVNPPLWELGHAAYFYEVFVLEELDGTPHFDPAMDDLWDSFHVEHRDRWREDLFPDLEQTRRYFSAVYDRVAERLRTRPLTARGRYLHRYAIFHQHMHIESMTWCRQTVGYAPPPHAPVPKAGLGAARAEDGERGDVHVPGGTYLIGMPADSSDFAGRDFAFDNEKPRHEVDLDAFAISPTLVSNGEFLAFVEDGGYERSELWSFGGRQWLATDVDVALALGEPEAVWRKPCHPLYWRQRDGEWQARLFDRWQTLRPDRPVTHVSYWEAEAFCAWAGRRLPSEAEWEAAALGNHSGAPIRRFPWGDEFDRKKADLDASYMAQQPVTAMAEGQSPFGCRQMLGTVWEWTRDQFLPYDGFAVDIYPFMSTLQFGDHKVSRGGSCATSSALIRGTYRQAYLPGRNDVYTGFRTCAR